MNLKTIILLHVVLFVLGSSGVCLVSPIFGINTEHTGGFKSAALSVFSTFINPKRPDLLEMAHLSHRCRDYFPQRQATLMQWVNKCQVQLTLEALPHETGPRSATTVEEPSLPAEHVMQTKEQRVIAVAR